ncbi:MAG TPA: arylsulfatase [Verrucomicrobiae bacterium]|nr:arylsulfatase [Verrucomicrobiae bacterium]
MARFRFLIIYALLFPGALLANAAAPRPINPLGDKLKPKKPNIIFILADDLGYGDLGCYGQTKIKTPNIDRLAAEGMRFTQFYAGSTVCAPSRSALMTGQHTGHTRIRGNDPVPLRPEDVTVAEVLQKAGYKTGAIGKWGLGLANTTGVPTKQGFEEWFGYLSQTHAHNYYPTQLFRNDEIMFFDENSGGRKGLYSHDLFTKAATNYIRVTKYFSFFLYLPYTIPHANNELRQKGMEVPSDAPYSKEDWPEPEKNKAAMITRLDRDIGRILDQLKSLEIDDNTIIFFTSDNGPHKEGGVKPEFFNSSGGLRGIKRDMYEGGIRVPMIVRWPGKVPAGKVSDQVWAFWDFLPTAAEIAGEAAITNVPTNHIDGISMLPTLLGRKQTNQHEFLYWEFHENGSKQAVRMGDWKAVRLAPKQPLELYNLKTDRPETNNVAADHADIVSKIEKYLLTAHTESERWPIRTAAEQAEAAKKRTGAKEDVN